jgi:hypothetical protein
MVKWSVGDSVERYWAKQNFWWRAKIIAERLAVRPGHSRRERQVLIHIDNEKGDRNDAWLPISTKELREPEKHVDHFQTDAGHVEDDMWLVDHIVEERGVGKSKEYLLRWQDWGPEWDEWRKAAVVCDILIAEWQAAQTVAEDAALRFESDEDRRCAIEHAESTIRLTAYELVDKLRRTKDRAARRVLLKIKAGDAWLFNALYEYFADGLPAHQLHEYLTPPRQTVGVRGHTPTVAYEFHIISATLVSQLLAREPEEPRRAGHVILRETAPPTAVGLLTPLTVTRRGPRDQPHKMTITIAAGFGALAARNGEAPPDWRFEEGVPPADTQAAQHFIRAALDAMEARTPGLVPAAMRE